MKISTGICLYFKDLARIAHKLLHADRTGLDVCPEKIFKTRTIAEFAGFHTAVFVLIDSS
jgi:hypothetical protein